MASKEALYNLVQCCFNDCDSDEVLNYEDIILKDLEVLEIINTHLLDIGKFYEDFIEEKFDYSVYLDDALYYEKLDENEEPITQQKFNKIKEWLEK